VVAKARRRRFTAKEKLRVLREADGCTRPGELGALLRDLGRPARLGLCLDTAHVYASGLYDGTPLGLERLLATLDANVGLERLTAIHLNDSKAAFNSRVDRHANVGEGQLGAAGLRPFFAHPALTGQPFILEVPGRNRSGPQKRDVDVAKALARGKALPGATITAENAEGADTGAED